LQVYLASLSVYLRYAIVTASGEVPWQFENCCKARLMSSSGSYPKKKPPLLGLHHGMLKLKLLWQRPA
jgi:hypothetical protein